ncbi:MAG: FG-GAP-like repeat-containing protein [Thermoanaerobaculia bacterium]
MTAPRTGRPGRPPRRLGRRRRRLRRAAWTLTALGALGLAVGAWVHRSSRPETWRSGEDLPEITERLSRGLPADAPRPAWTDVTAEAGLAGVPTFAGERSSQLPEDMGPGAAWGDFDNDGDDDLFVVSAGGPLTGDPASWAPSLLYENLGDGTFRRVADFPELRIVGMGAAWGDADGDGWLDLVVTGYRTLLLFRNQEGRLVLDETAFAAVPDAGEGFWAGAAWGDFDNDRDLDLYVTGYVRYVEDANARDQVSRQYGHAVPYTLNPVSFEPERNLLLQNAGDGTFTDVAEELGVDNPEGRSLGALWHDFDADGHLDLYVANDVSDNAFYRNLGDGTFEDAGHSAWIADYRGAMGLAAGDWNRDGDDDLFVTHWVAQENALYDSLLVDGGRGGPRTDGPDALPRLGFTDRAAGLGLGQSALRFVGWGTEFVDLDNDGWLDLVVANGSTFESKDDPTRLEPQVPQLLWNRWGEHFHDLAPLSEVLSVPHVGRGLAVSDYDLDGDPDLLFVHHGEGPQLLRNDMASGRSLQLRLVSRTADGELRGFGDGATVVARLRGTEETGLGVPEDGPRPAGSRGGAGTDTPAGSQGASGPGTAAGAGEAADAVVLRRTVGGASYLSQSSRTLHLGLGEADRIEELEVHWLGGGTDVYRDLEAGAVWELREGDPSPVLLRETGPAGAAGPASSSEASDAPGAGAGPADPDGPAEALPDDPKERTLAFWQAQRAGMDALKKDRDPEAAEPHFRRALALDPDHEDARYYLAAALVAQEEVGEALEHLRELARRNPQSHRAFKRWGTLEALAARSPEELDEAAKALERSLEINQEETGSLLVLAEIDLLRGDRDRARQHLGWATATNVRAVGGQFLLGYLEWKDGRSEEARQRLEKARAALGPDWVPEGSVAEGDTKATMHTEESPLARFWRTWDGEPDPETAYATLDEHLRGFAG